MRHEVETLLRADRAAGDGAFIRRAVAREVLGISHTLRIKGPRRGDTP